MDSRSTLRALKRAHGPRVSLAVCGINETFCERGEFSGYPNPSLDLYKRHYASLLGRTELVSMLATLGARMGVQLAGEFTERVIQAFGGHAYLARQFCSEASKGKPRPVTLVGQDFETAYRKFMASRAPAVLGSVMSSLARFYPEEYEVLRSVARGDRSRAAATTHLKAYGLLDEAGDVAFDSLREYAVSHTTDEVRSVRYERLGELGGGTTGVVYKSFDRDRHRFCAVKHYRCDDAERVARLEWEMLSIIGSDATPEPYELTGVDGNPAVVMELIEGRTLADYIEHERPSAAKIQAIVAALLASVASIHPSTERREGLRARLSEKTSISDEDYQSFLAVVESGCLHRDLKPANIVLSDDRIRLLDVQLSKSVDRAGLTQVGTPAYLPPDVGVVTWNPSSDLFAIGVMVHELLFGVRPERDRVLLHVERVQDGMLRSELLALFFGGGLVSAPGSGDRPRSTEEFRSAWESVITSQGWNDETLQGLRAGLACA